MNSPWIFISTYHALSKLRNTVEAYYWQKTLIINLPMVPAITSITANHRTSIVRKTTSRTVIYLTSVVLLLWKKRIDFSFFTFFFFSWALWKCLTKYYKRHMKEFLLSVTLKMLITSLDKSNVFALENSTFFYFILI